MTPTGDAPSRPPLVRHLGLVGLAATGICSMLGAAINTIPFTMQRNVPGIDGFVLPAFLLAAIPALLAALAYAALASAMPRAGGSYIYASRGLSPYLGFVASFSQWFGLSIAIGVVSYIIPAFLRDVAIPLGLTDLANVFDGPVGRPLIALAILWTFVLVNLRGTQLYETLLIPLMVLMFVLGSVVIVAGFSHNHTDFAAALLAREGRTVPEVTRSAPGFMTLLAATPVLFASFIGFDSIAQAGGEARNPSRNLPLAIGIAVISVGAYYMLFTAAVYHAVPWQYVAEQALVRDVTAPGLLSYLLSPAWTVAIVAGAAVALINDLPAMLLAVSRLMFAWSDDGIFPRLFARVHPTWRTPHLAIIASGVVASLSIVGSHLAGDFFLGVDILVTSMLVTYALMALTVLTLPSRNPALAHQVTVMRSAALRVPVAVAALLLTSGLLVVQVLKDLNAPTSAWYFHSTPVWVIVLVAASLIHWRERRTLERDGVDVRARFAVLPSE